jgi:hypothetical protein
MAANLHVISGQLRLNQPQGHAEVDFSTGGWLGLRAAWISLARDAITGPVLT